VCGGMGEGVRGRCEGSGSRGAVARQWSGRLVGGRGKRCAGRRRSRLAAVNKEKKARGILEVLAVRDWSVRGKGLQKGGGGGVGKGKKY